MKRYVSTDAASSEVLAIEKQVARAIDGQDFAVVLTTMNKMVSVILREFSEASGQPLVDLADQFDSNLRYLMGLAPQGVMPDRREMN